MAVGTTNFPTALDTVLELIEAANNSTPTLDGAIAYSKLNLAGSATNADLAVQQELSRIEARQASLGDHALTLFDRGSAPLT